MNWYTACEDIKFLLEATYQVIFPLPCVPAVLYNFVTGLYLPGKQYEMLYMAWYSMV